MPLSSQLIAAIEQGQYDNTFVMLYGAEKAPAQRARYIETIHSFEEIFGTGRDLRLYSTPGRTEIGGNHTDHNFGKVLAAAVNLDIIAVVALSEQPVIRVKSKGFSRMDVVETDKLIPVQKEMGTSAAMVRGVAAGIVQRGGSVQGFDAYTTSDVLRGSGLSSSAAFEVCVSQIINTEFNEGRFSAVELGKISQYAENVFFGKPSGLMDQTACAVGSAITIDFKDPENPVVNEIPFDLAKHGYSLVITDTKGSHADLTDEYGFIRAEMEAVAAEFGKQVLREVDENEMLAQLPALRAKLGDRAVLRALHFFAECHRVDEEAAAIQNDDFVCFQKLIVESGHSSFEYNQNAYSSKNPKEQGVSLGLALSQSVLSEQGAWRLQGGGFAGTIQAFVPNDRLDAYCKRLTSVFGDDACYVLSVRGAGAVKVEA